MTQDQINRAIEWLTMEPSERTIGKGAKEFVERWDETNAVSLEALTLLEQAGDNIGKCKACGNVLQKEGCPACHEKEQAGEGDGICYDSEVFHPVGKGDVPPSPCGEEFVPYGKEWEKEMRQFTKEQLISKLKETFQACQRYREALEKIIQADKDLLTNHDSWGWAMNEMTEEVNDSLDNLFGAINEAKTALEAGKEER